MNKLLRNLLVLVFLLPGPAARAQVVSFAGKVLGVSLGYSHPRTTWPTRRPAPQVANGLSVSLLLDATRVENGVSVAFFGTGGAGAQRAAG